MRYIGSCEQRPEECQVKRRLKILLGIAFLAPTTILDAADGNWAESHFFRIVHVTPDGQGDGKSWRHATSLQRLVDGAEDEAAILNPKGTVPCCQLWLGRGEHRLSKRLYANRDFHVSILGGFAGSETAAEDRDPEANRTTVVLDGCQLLFTRWAHQLTVDGLTIRDGEADHGGAIDVVGSYGGGNNILISNVDFVNCRARLGGGAVRIQRASKGLETRNPRIVDCRFINCSAIGTDDISGGGAVMIYELYQPSITYSMICEGQTPPLYGKYQHCAAIAHFDGQFFVVWQSNPTVYIEWARGRKIYFSRSANFKTWTAPKLVAPDLPHLGGTQPMLLGAPNGELWCIWLCSASEKNVHGLWLSTRRTASGEWTHRRMLSEDRLDHEYSLYPQSNPSVLSSGRIIAPFIARVGDSREPAGVFLYTDDNGATWEMSNWIRWPSDAHSRDVATWSGFRESHTYCGVRQNTTEFSE